ncbi:Scr1 family TA system antitoxin-like transcriptional regulator [Streptomyces sp. NPDC006197]|uniref:helix-turn-helix domain-containing protein n=1 Tax=Streptomyces sp. NPDC006197 TaxID=3156685 RepID=UPI0033B1DCA7
MAKGKQQDAWAFFGEVLKERREAAGLTQGELGARVFVSGAYIGLFEQGIRKPQPDVANRIDEVLQTGGIFERTWRQLINKSPYASYFSEVAELEAVATKLCEFAPTVVPRTTGAHASMDGSLRLMEFLDQPPTAYTETSFSGTLLDDPAVVKRAQRAYDLSNAQWFKSSYSNGQGGACGARPTPVRAPRGRAARSR